jgi:hypothetical protein
LLADLHDQSSPLGEVARLTRRPNVKNLVDSSSGESIDKGIQQGYKKAGEPGAFILGFTRGFYFQQGRRHGGVVGVIGQ